MSSRKYIITAMLVLIAIMVASSLTVYGRPPSHASDPYRPLEAGIQITIRSNPTYNSLCSIGFPAYYTILGDPYNYYGIVTASHCGDETNRTYQPTIGINNYIGDIVRDGRIYNDGSFNNVKATDAAFILVETRLWNENPQHISRRVISNISITGYDYIYSYDTNGDDIIHGRGITKVGRTTGATSGKIICPSTRLSWLAGDQVCILPHLYSGLLFNHTAYSLGGDSGGIVYYVPRPPIKPDYPKYVKVLGIHLRFFKDAPGVYGAAPVSAILEDLGISAWGGSYD